MQVVEPDSLYENLESALLQINCDIGVAECHGILCGMLCNPEYFDTSLWLRHVTGQNDLAVFGDEDSGHVIWQMLSATITNIEDDITLAIMIPNDDTPLVERTLALGAWCRGFLSGYGLTGGNDLSALSEDSRGFIKDLRDIGKVDDIAAQGNDDEFALAEITEYVRVGAVLIREETRDAAEQSEINDTIH